MEAYNDYINMFGWMSNTTVIIIITIVILVFTVIFGIAKYMINIAIIKKSVKEAIKELNAEEKKKLLDSTDENKNTTNNM
jgi:uncharacterized membrane protein YvbJ